MRVFRLTRWYCHYGAAANLQMIRKRPVYVAFNDAGARFTVLRTRGGIELLNRASRLGDYDDTDGLGESWAFAPDEDAREFIPEHHWPDELCVLLAKQALLEGEE